MIEVNSVLLVGIISYKTSGCCYCYYCYCYCCYYCYYYCYCYCYYCYYYYCYCCCCCYCYYCAFAYNLFCGDDCDENLVFDGVEGCRELVGVVGKEKLEESKFSKDSIEGFSLLVEL
jgi:hypothetical protein